MMKIIYVESAYLDLDWYRKYYAVVFPAGRKNAAKHYMHAVTNLQQNPMIGQAIEGTSARKLVINRTPFTIIYRVYQNEIRVYRVLDGCAKPHEIA